MQLGVEPTEVQVVLVRLREAPSDARWDEVAWQPPVSCDHETKVCVECLGYWRIDHDVALVLG